MFSEFTYLLRACKTIGQGLHDKEMIQAEKQLGKPLDNPEVDQPRKYERKYIFMLFITGFKVRQEILVQERVK